MKKLKIMLIDDSTIEMYFNLKSIEMGIKDTDVVTFLKAKKAIEYLSSQARLSKPDSIGIPDIILVDVHMPDMDGFAFLDTLEQLGNLNLQKTKIYILSASSDEKDIKDAQKHSACDGFISKPLTLESVRRIENEARQGVGPFK